MLVHSIGERAAAAATDAAWAQWGALTSAAVAAAAEPLWTVVDPEALVLVSLAVREREGRVGDLLASWARTGAWLLSVQRMTTLARAFPPSVATGVGDFARMAAEAGDRRWTRHAAPVGADTPPRRKDAGPLRLTAASNLMLRLRAGLGVGAKADLLAILLGLHGEPASLRTLVAAAGYTDRTLRTAADEMALAGLIGALPGTPAAYRADPRRWTAVLGEAGADGTPPWRGWAAAFAFLAGVMEWERTREEQNWSAYVASSRARDLVAMHGQAFRHAGIFPPDRAEPSGAAYLERFAEIVEFVAGWTEEHLRG